MRKSSRLSSESEIRSPFSDSRRISAAIARSIKRYPESIKRISAWSDDSYRDRERNKGTEKKKMRKQHASKRKIRSSRNQFLSERRKKKNNSPRRKLAITHPPQPFPHLQPEPHPQFPPQHDIFNDEQRRTKRFEACGWNQTRTSHDWTSVMGRAMASIYRGGGGLREYIYRTRVTILADGILAHSHEAALFASTYPACQSLVWLSVVLVFVGSQKMDQKTMRKLINGLHLIKLKVNQRLIFNWWIVPKRAFIGPSTISQVLLCYRQ